MQLIVSGRSLDKAHTKACVKFRSRDLPEIKRYRTPKSHLTQANFSSLLIKQLAHFQ